MIDWDVLKSYLHLDDDRDFELVLTLEDSAVAIVAKERAAYLGPPKTFQETLSADSVYLRYPPREITEVVTMGFNLFNWAGWETLSPDQYAVVGNALVRTGGPTWPRGGLVRVTYTAGYASEYEVPADIRADILRVTSDLYSNRLPTPSRETLTALRAHRQGWP